MRRGFTLMELAFVLVLAGLVSGIAIQLSQSGGNAECYATTQTQMATIREAMDRYAEKNDKLPMPASRVYGVEDKNYGREPTSPAEIAAAHLDDAGVGGVTFGALPFQALGLAPSYAADCWGNKFTYVVTTAFTSNTPTGGYPDASVLAAITIVGSATNAAYAVISHGANGSELGKGGVKANYSDLSATPDKKWCTSGVGSPIENQNCTATTTTLSAAPFNDGKDSGTNLFDDLIIFKGKNKLVGTPCPATPITTPITWEAGKCSALANAAPDGNSQPLTNTASGFTGAATATCQNGSFTVSATSCTPLPSGMWKRSTVHWYNILGNTLFPDCSSMSIQPGSTIFFGSPVCYRVPSDYSDALYWDGGGPAAVCGSASGSSFPTPPNANMCNVGAYGIVLDRGTKWTWACITGNGAPVECEADKGPLPPTSCLAPWGAAIVNGASVDAYSAATAPDCNSVKQTRTCTNGNFSPTPFNGGFTHEVCTNSVVGSCLDNDCGTKSNFTRWCEYNPMSGLSTGQVLRCDNGIISIDMFSTSCSSSSIGCSDPDAPPGSCPLPWGGSIANGQSTPAFSAANAPDCNAAGVKETRTCNNGALSGTFTGQSCAPVGDVCFCNILYWDGSSERRNADKNSCDNNGMGGGAISSSCEGPAVPLNWVLKSSSSAPDSRCDPRRTDVEYLQIADGYNNQGACATDDRGVAVGGRGDGCAGYYPNTGVPGYPCHPTDG